MEKYLVLFYEFGTAARGFIKSFKNKLDAKNYVINNFENPTDIQIIKVTKDIEDEYAFEIEAGIIEVFD